MIPRELNPEWFWRCRFFIAGWKVLVLAVFGAAWGSSVIWMQIAYPSALGILATMCATGAFLGLVPLVLRGLRR